MFDLILDSVEDFHTVEERRLHRIIGGLGLDLAYELKHYDGHLLGDEAEEDVRRFLSE